MCMRLRHTFISPTIPARRPQERAGHGCIAVSGGCISTARPMNADAFNIAVSFRPDRRMKFPIKNRR
jgi:hypothetical protein